MGNFNFYLIAPNLSEQMGGEAMKALHIFIKMKKVHANVVQITHGRNRDELIGRLKLEKVVFVEDDFVTRLLWKSVVFRMLVDVWFGYRATRMADILIKTLGDVDARNFVHQTEPNSPVIPRFVSSSSINVFGPINGNVYYPRAFRAKESMLVKLRRYFICRFNDSIVCCGLALRKDMFCLSQAAIELELRS